MHSLHMYAVTDDERIELPKYFNMTLTGLSAIAAFLGVYLGASVASSDHIFSDTSEEAESVGSQLDVIEMKRKKIDLRA